MPQSLPAVVRDLGSQQNFDKIALLLSNAVLRLVTEEELKINFGTSSVTFSEAAEATKAVEHGLDAVPKFAIAFPILPTTESFQGSAREGSATTSEITFQFNSDGGVEISATRSFYWLAIG